MAPVKAEYYGEVDAGEEPEALVARGKRSIEIQEKRLKYVQEEKVQKLRERHKRLADEKKRRLEEISASSLALRHVKAS